MNLHSSVKKGWRGRRSGVRWSHLWAKGPLWAVVRESFLSPSHPGCQASPGKSGCQDLHRVIRGTWQLLLQTPAQRLAARKFHHHCVHPEDCRPAHREPPTRDYGEGLPMKPFERLASAHSRMAGTLSPSWGCASRLGWPGVSRTASGPWRGVSPIL